MDRHRSGTSGPTLRPHVLFVRIFTLISTEEEGLMVMWERRLNQILTRNAAPSQEALGATFGLAQTVACVARAGSPAFVRYASDLP